MTIRFQRVVNLQLILTGLIAMMILLIMKNITAIKEMEKINDKNLNEFILKPSTRKNKKYMLVSNNSPSIHFGSYGMSDYTIHKD